MQKVVFLTGGATGIGAAIARQLATEKHAIILAVCAPERAEPLCEELRALGGEAMTVTCDVRDAESVRRALDSARARFGRINVVINNAGRIDPIGTIAETDPEDWRDGMETNLFGPYLVTRAALPALQASRGMIVNISTGAASVPRRAWSAYCASKAGLSMLTRCTAIEVAEHGIFVVAVQPGMVDTGMQTRIRASGANEVSRIDRADLLPPTAPARAIAWLLREAPAELHGRDLSLADLRKHAGPASNW